LKREFLALQEKIKSEEISIRFVFYDGRCCAFSNFEVNIKLAPPGTPPTAEGVAVKARLCGPFPNMLGECLCARSDSGYRSMSDNTISYLTYFLPSISSFS